MKRWINRMDPEAAERRGGDDLDHLISDDRAALLNGYRSPEKGKKRTAALLAVVGSEIVLALAPPPAPPSTGGSAAGAIAATTSDPGTNALRLITAPGAPQLVTVSLAPDTGGFTPASLTETQGFQAASVTVEGEDPSEVFANALLAERIEGLAPAPVPYFAGYVAPPPVR